MQVHAGLSALLLALALTGQPALGQSADAARQLYVDGQYDAALAVLRPLAEAGDAMAQNILGAAYDDGFGVPVDHGQTLAWWQRSAAQGYDKAIYNLGVFHDAGRPGHPPDDATAVFYYRQAVALNYAEAFTNLGFMTYSGRVEGSTPADAVALYEAGRAAGAATSIHNLADVYREGRAVPEDLGKALGYYREAAALGLPISLHALAAMYDNGYGTPRDVHAALALYTQAMNAGFDRSPVSLAYLVTFEEGYFTDPVYGHALCLYALAEASPARAEEFAPDCATIQAGLSEEEIALGEELYRSW